MKITKQMLIDYFEKGMSPYDVGLDQIYIDFKLEPSDLPFLEIFIKELLEEKWIVRSVNEDGLYEYDPGKKLNYGGLRG
jgi:hypothetical protein